MEVFFCFPEFLFLKFKTFKGFFKGFSNVFFFFKGFRYKVILGFSKSFLRFSDVLGGGS